MLMLLRRTPRRGSSGVPCNMWFPWLECRLPPVWLLSPAGAAVVCVVPVLWHGVLYPSGAHLAPAGW